MIHEAGWLSCLDHPDDCPDGMLILCPEVEVDAEWWQLVNDQPVLPVTQKLHVSFLRQHPYEFLPALAKKIQTRSLGS